MRNAPLRKPIAKSSSLRRRAIHESMETGLETRRVTRAAFLGIFWLAVVTVVPARVGYSFDESKVAKRPATSPISEARQWFEDAKYGLFIDWGIDSLLGKGESVMDNDKLSIREYAKLLPRFNPTRFDAEAWVKLAKQAGVKYITITTKHHDGFCMFASRLTDYDIVDATPYHTDPLKTLAVACRQQEIKLFFAYSLLDWHHPDYFPLGKTGQATGREPKGDWKRYVAYYQGQVRELCTNYGQIGGIWFDGLWDRPDADWDLIGYVPPYPRTSAERSGREQPSRRTQSRSGLAGIRGWTCLSRRDRTGSNKGGIAPNPTARELADDQRFNGLQSSRYQLQECGADHPRLGRRRGAGGQPEADCGCRARWHDRPRGDPSDCSKPASGWRPMATRSTGPTRGRFQPQPWGILTARGPRDHVEKIYIARPQAQESHADSLRSVACVDTLLLGNTTPMRMTETPGDLVLDIPKDALDADRHHRRVDAQIGRAARTKRCEDWSAAESPNRC